MMKTALLSILTSYFICFYAAAADGIDQVNLSRALREILPEMSFVAGDQSWTGGIQTNQISAVTLRANSAYLIFSAPANSKPAKIAERIRDALQKRCDLPVDGAQSWLRQMPKDVGDDDFAEAYYHSGTASSQPPQYTCFSVRVVRLANTRFGISLNYALLK